MDSAVEVSLLGFEYECLWKGVWICVGVLGLGVSVGTGYLFLEDYGLWLDGDS